MVVSEQGLLPCSDCEGSGIGRISGLYFAIDGAGAQSINDAGDVLEEYYGSEVLRNFLYEYKDPMYPYSLPASTEDSIYSSDFLIHSLNMDAIDDTDLLGDWVSNNIFYFNIEDDVAGVAGIYYTSGNRFDGLNSKYPALCNIVVSDIDRVLAGAETSSVAGMTIASTPSFSHSDLIDSMETRRQFVRCQ